MRRFVLVIVTALTLAFVSGCFNRPTEAKVKSDSESNFERMKKLEEKGDQKGKKKSGFGKPDT
jgi:hypothetical protein